MSLHTTQLISCPFSSFTLLDDDPSSEHWEIDDVDWDGIEDNRSDWDGWVFGWEVITLSESVGRFESIAEEAEDTLLRFEIKLGGNGSRGLHSIGRIPSLLSEDDTDVSEAVTWDADMTFGSRHTFAVGDATKAITSGFHNKIYLWLLPKFYDTHNIWTWHDVPSNLY